MMEDFEVGLELLRVEMAELALVRDRLPIRIVYGAGGGEEGFYCLEA